MKGYDKNMYNVILTNQEGEEFYVNSDLDVTRIYNESLKLKYEFEDYEDAENVRNDFIARCPISYKNGTYKIEVVQM